MMMEDANPFYKDMYIIYADFKGLFNGADHRIVFKQMRELSMPISLVDTCEKLYGVSTTIYITPYGTSTLTGVPYRETRSHHSSSHYF
jgi:Tfp pilus assembly protein PilZ